jgi:hypothetical protein
MANKEHLAQLEHTRHRQDVKEWNAWREQHSEIRPDLQGADLCKRFLSGINLSGANLSGANLSEADLSSSNLSRADLSRTDLSRAAISRANLSEASFIDANIRGASFRDSSIAGASFAGTQGVAHAKRLENTLLSSQQDVRNFEQCEREWPERWFDWERFRIIGQLPLFAISYTTLIFIPIFFYLLAFYNEKIELMQNVVQAIIPSPTASSGSSEHSSDELSDMTGQIRTSILFHLKKQPIPSQSFSLLVSTLLLAAASTLYTFFCPSRVKEFSRDQWCDQIGRSLIHYWPLAWKHRPIRLLCAAFYILGGAGALWVIMTKVYRAAWFIYKNS